MTEGQTPRRLCRTVSAHLLGGLLWMGLVDVAIRRSHRLDRMVPGATHLLEEAGALEQLAPPPDFFGGRSMTADDLLFRDRRHAGRVLATHLEQYRGRAGLLVLALPRGGVAVGFEVARELQAPLNIFVVRKLGVPGHEEYAMGAIASGGVKVMNPMPGFTVRPEAIAAVVLREQAELVRREKLYRKHNTGLSPLRQVGSYGLDLYSLLSAIQAVLTYLDKLDPQAARRARQRCACFDHAAEDSQAYGYAASFGLKGVARTRWCNKLVQQLREMNRRAAEMTPTPGLERDEGFYAQQNARLVCNADEYYRTMFHGRVSSWNLRDSHMSETLHALDRHLGTGGQPPRIAVWAHNSHLGDASAPEMGGQNEWNMWASSCASAMRTMRC